MEGLLLFGIEVIGWTAYQLSKKRENQYSSLIFVPFTKQHMDKTLVVDCYHPSCKQITHHLREKHQKALNDNANRGDSSTDGVLNAIRRRSPYITNNTYVSSNHFDVDSFLSVWSAVNQNCAMKYEKFIREAAKIGDFRELTLQEDWQYQALRLVCWLNSEEKRLYFGPFEGKGYRVIKKVNVGTTDEQRIEVDVSNDESKDETNKLIAFLETFTKAVENICTTTCDPIYIEQSEKEYQQVVTGYHRLNSPDNSTTIVQRYPNLSLVIIRTPEPLHYYSLFSVSHGLDIVMSIYSKNRYEVEEKFTTQVDITSRPTFPRVDMRPLAKRLNEVENTLKSQHQVSNDYYWRADPINIGGPILRIESKAYDLSRAERYGAPYDRPIFSSLIDPKQFEEMILSFFQFVYSYDVKPKIDWETAEIVEFNRFIDSKLHEWKF